MAPLNNRFWQDLALKTDNDREWSPVPNQYPELGFERPAGTGDAWLAVLKGEKLIPFWHFAPGDGIDLAAYVANPTPTSAAEWVQRTAARHYAKQGVVVDSQSWRRFRRLPGGIVRDIAEPIRAKLHGAGRLN